MAAKKPAETPKKAARTTKKEENAFTAEEREAMRERAREMKAASRRGGGEDAEAEVLAKIASMPEPDRTKATRVHALVKANAPSLRAKTWYGMPAYARDGEVVCFFQSADKFKARYATLGFSDEARLDEGAMWPTAYAIHELDASAEARIAALLRKAVG